MSKENKSFPLPITMSEQLKLFFVAVTNDKLLQKKLLLT